MTTWPHGDHAGRSWHATNPDLGWRFHLGTLFRRWVRRRRTRRFPLRSPLSWLRQGG